MRHTYFHLVLMLAIVLVLFLSACTRPLAYPQQRHQYRQSLKLRICLPCPGEHGSLPYRPGRVQRGQAGNQH